MSNSIFQMPNANIKRRPNRASGGRPPGRERTWMTGYVLPEETAILVGIHDSKKLLDGAWFRFWRVRVPLQITTHPVDFPALRFFDVGSFCHRRLNDRGRLAEVWTNFDNLHALARNANVQIQLRANMDWWTLRFQKLRNGALNFLCFKLTECHMDSLWERPHNACSMRAYGMKPKAQCSRRRRACTCYARTLCSYYLIWHRTVLASGNNYHLSISVLTKSLICIHARPHPWISQRRR